MNRSCRGMSLMDRISWTVVGLVDLGAFFAVHLLKVAIADIQLCSNLLEVILFGQLFTHVGDSGLQHDSLTATLTRHAGHDLSQTVKAFANSLTTFLF